MFLCAASLALFAALWAVNAVADPDGRMASGAVEGRLNILEQYNLPLEEISGLALGQGEPDSIGIYAVGDASFDAALFVFHPSTGAVSIEVRNVASTLHAKAGASSQWEAVSADGQSSVCILAETTSRVDCLGADLKRKVGHIKLDVSGIGRLNKVWKKEANSRGEGMVLMRRGHILLLKEKKPSLIVEFGPKGEAANGWSAEAGLQAGEAFEMPKSGKLVALKVWDFAESLSAIAADASEISVGPDGRLYMLSQQDARLIRLERNLRPDEDKVRATAWWHLPEQLDGAEGLVIDNELHPWVAIDVHSMHRPNLFRLSRIDPP
jgi:hypothetical protein